MSAVSAELTAPAGMDSDGLSHWAVQGKCTQQDPEAFFVSGADQHKAKSVCRGCPVRNLCLADALDHRIEFGIWGGMTERERRKLLRDRPHVTSWLPLLERAQEREPLGAAQSGRSRGSLR